MATMVPGGLAAALLLLVAATATTAAAVVPPQQPKRSAATASVSSSAAGLAYLSLGCFWTSEHLFDCDPLLRGLRKAPDPSDCPTDGGSVSDRTCAPTTTVVGYMGGSGSHPTYHNYTIGDSYSETLRLVYDPVATPFADLLTAFWSFAPDPTRPAPNTAHSLRIFYTTEVQRTEAAASIAAANRSMPGAAEHVELVPASGLQFWKAEEYHQHYFEKSGRFCNGSRSSPAAPVAGGGSVVRARIIL
jgi:peptide-methionine (S)-S-oxide reductase